MAGTGRPRAAAAVALWLASAGALAAAPQGPLELRTPGTLRDLFLDVVAWDAREIGSPRFELRWAMANDWSTPTLLARGGRAVLVRLDEQADSLSVSVRLPWGAVAGAPAGSWSRRLATALELRATAHWGGYSDGPIEAWHALGNYGDFARNLYPRDQVHVALREPGGTALVALSNPVVSVGDLVLRNQVLLWEGGEPLAEGPGARAGVSLRVDVAAPVGRLALLGGSGGWDAGAGIEGTWQATPWLVGHALAAASLWSGLPRGFPLQPRRWHGSLDLSLVFLVGEWALILEDRFATAAFEGGWTLVDAGPGGTAQTSASYAVLRPQNQVALGVRVRGLAFWLMEDFTLGHNPGNGAGDWFYDTNAPDVAIGVTLTLPP